MKKYKIIYADPPWQHDRWKRGNRRPSLHYPVMSLEDIKDMDIDGISGPDCWLFMWATFPHLPEALETIASWGFTYKTIAFTWVKRNKKASSWFWGCGSYTRANAEICLLGRKGSLKRESASVHSVIDTPIEGHSKKPDVARKRIVELCGNLPRVELFARQPSKGWDVWGNEVENNFKFPHKG